MYSTYGVSCSLGALVPIPPGTKGTSSRGAVSRVCVGMIVSQIVDLWAFGIRARVVTGSRDGPMSARSRYVERDKMLKTSRAPRTSRAWSPGKSSIPIRVGVAEAVARVVSNARALMMVVYGRPV